MAERNGDQLQNDGAKREMSNGVEPASVAGITMISVSAVMQWLDVNSGAIVSICSIIGAICAIAGAYRSYKKDKDTEWVDKIVKKPKK